MQDLNDTYVEKLAECTWNKDILGEDFHGQFVATLVDIFPSTKKSSPDILVLKINDKKINIRKPISKRWFAKSLNDTFIVTKVMVKNKGFLHASQTYNNNGHDRDIGFTDLFSMLGKDETKAKIMSIQIMEENDDNYICYINKEVHRVKKDFTLHIDDETKKLNTVLYVDVSDAKDRNIVILGSNFHEARIKYLSLHKHEQQSDANITQPTTTKDKFLRYHATSNIALIDREFEGLICLEVLEVTKDVNEHGARRHMYVEVNENQIAQMKISTKDEWKTLSGDETLLVYKRIYDAYDGKPLAKLEIRKRTKNFDEMDVIALRDLLPHKLGMRKQIVMEFVYATDNYLVIFAENNLHKITKSEQLENLFSEHNRTLKLATSDDGSFHLLASTTTWENVA